MPVDPKELREAITQAALTFERLRLPLTEAQYDKHAAVLRAFLDSGLTESERETVGKVVEELRRPLLNEPGTPMWIRAWVREQAAALAPIAEGK